MPLPGTSTKTPSKLCPCIRDLYFDLLSEADKLGIPVTTIETGRDLERQTYYVKVGVSRTMKSKHVAQPFSLAFDIAPTEYLPLKGWNGNGKAWATLGKLGQKLGLTWGGAWKTIVDKPHFELDSCQCKD